MFPSTPSAIRSVMKPVLSRLALSVASFFLMAGAIGRPLSPEQLPEPPKLVICAACHGTQGEGGAPGAPRLGGQDTAYLEHALIMFKSRTRASPIMLPIAASLSDSEIHDLAVYFGSLKGTRVLEAASPPARLVEAGRLLAYEGAQSDSTPACFSCHGPTGHGVGARFPGIAGQPITFIVDRLHEFQARAKTGTPAPASMTSVAATMSESQITETAAYLSTLSPWPDASSVSKLPAVSSSTNGP